jgi:hypothetical protein
MRKDYEIDEMTGYCVLDDNDRCVASFINFEYAIDYCKAKYQHNPKSSWTIAHKGQIAYYLSSTKPRGSYSIN